MYLLNIISCNIIYPQRYHSEDWYSVSPVALKTASILHCLIKNKMVLPFILPESEMKKQKSGWLEDMLFFYFY